jgi:hypothetical protein
MKNQEKHQNTERNNATTPKLLILSNKKCSKPISPTKRKISSREIPLNISNNSSTNITTNQPTRKRTKRTSRKARSRNRSNRRKTRQIMAQQPGKAQPTTRNSNWQQRSISVRKKPEMECIK